MSKLRNYCTHYLIPLPELSTTFSWERGSQGVTVNTLQLDKAKCDKFLRWDGWGGQAKESLSRQAQLFDLAPIVARYVNAANEFAAWFWDEINRRSASLIDEMMNKAMELKLWHDENVGPLSGLSAVT